jgi:hypothetical protein
MHRWLLTFAVLAALCDHALAGTLTFDEQGHGTTGAGVLAPDPGPGGLPAVLTYSLGFAVVPGDVLVVDDGIPRDVVRFNVPSTGGPGTLVFYSDDTDGFDSLADTVHAPFFIYSNQVAIPEVGPEGDNGAVYTPGSNNPGFVAGVDPVTYHFISDGTVPEPTWGGLSLFGGLAVMKRRRRGSVPR